MTDSLFGPFKPGSPGKQDCSDGQASGLPSANFSYIQKAFNNYAETPTPNPYSKPQCPPYYHSTAQIDSLQINTNLTSPSASITNITGNINVQSWKGFDIKHPNKDGHRLRHICMEGPEADTHLYGGSRGWCLYQRKM